MLGSERAWTLDDMAKLDSYMRERMFRRWLSVLLILSVAAFGHAPSRAMMMPAGLAAVEAAAAAPIAIPCAPADMQRHDCCEDDGKAKMNCTWDADCAAMCHVNIGIEPATAAPFCAIGLSRSFAMLEPRSPAPRRPQSLLRPPIL
jgi:hypothetical protein